MELRGIYTPAITPLNEDMSINWNGFDAILEHLIAAGVHGIVVGGTTGEYYVHTVEERWKRSAARRMSLPGAWR